MAESIFINNRVSIPLRELHLRFSRSGGRGGQNVNKVETRVEIVFDVDNSPTLTDQEKVRIRHALKQSLSADGVLRIVSQESRSQWQNRIGAIERFAEILRAALKPRKKRVRTTPPSDAKLKRIESKKRRSQVKAMRKVSREEY